MKGITSKILYAIFLLVLALASFAQNSILTDYISTEWTTADGLPANSITDVIQTSDGYIYLGTYEGLVRFNGFEFTLLNKYSGNTYNFISARTLFQDSQGNLWVGSKGEGLQKISIEGKESSFIITECYQTTPFVPLKKTTRETFGWEQLEGSVILPLKDKLFFQKQMKLSTSQIV